MLGRIAALSAQYFYFLSPRYARICLYAGALATFNHHAQIKHGDSKQDEVFVEHKKVWTTEGKTMKNYLLVALVALCLTAPELFALQAAPAKPLPDNVVLTEGVEFLEIDGHQLLLDLYRPKSTKGEVPLVVWVHGGGWNKGSRSKCPIAWLCNEGFAVASVDYRLTDKAQWPAQIEDCRAAVAFLRTNGKQYGLAVERIGVCGASAGGHLVALMGTLDQNEQAQSESGIQAVCDFFGPTDLLTMPNNVLDAGETEADLAKVNGAKLLGGIVRDQPEKARHASALHQVSSNDPPMLIVHGDADEDVPIAQSKRLHQKLIAAGCESTLHVVPGAGHGVKNCQTTETQKLMLEFFQKHIHQPKSQTNRTPNGGGVKHLFTARLLLRRLEKCDLTDSQMARFNQLSADLRTRIDKMRSDVGITKDLIKARDTAYSAAKKAGLKGDPLWQAVQSEASLSDDQTGVFRKTQEIYSEFRKSVTEILTEDQLLAFRKTKKKR